MFASEHKKLKERNQGVAMTLLEWNFSELKQRHKISLKFYMELISSYKRSVAVIRKQRFLTPLLYCFCF